MKDTYKEAKVFEYPNMVARVHVPDLSNEEREQRMKVIHKAATDLLLKGTKQ